MNALHSKARLRSLNNGFKLGKGDEAITHLQSANDTILFSSTSLEEVLVLKRILRFSELSSRLKINLAKSVLVVVGCLDEVIQP